MMDDLDKVWIGVFMAHVNSPMRVAGPMVPTPTELLTIEKLAKDHVDFARHVADAAVEAVKKYQEEYERRE